jgi:AAA15 family ATPase/GTPase
MIANISISNYKSIQKIELPLSKVNVFIGENGSGKSNILEAIGMACSAQSQPNAIKTDDLWSKGIRVAKPALTFNSFIGKTQKERIEIDLNNHKINLVADNDNDIFASWKDTENNFLDKLNKFVAEYTALEKEGIDKQDNLFKNLHNELSKYMQEMNFLIFNINSNALRGFTSESKKEPLGIFGEGLDVLLSTFNEEQTNEIKSYNFISWLEDYVISDSLQTEGYKLGRSRSKLYFTDKYMQKKNNLFSAENVNEGALHILFYLALFISEKTPVFFAIDNIETALNPYLCRKLMQAITELAVKYNKQVLITTHNPAILDGLNLNDSNQKLFIVKRTDDGQTKVDELKSKSQITDSKYKLSELWMRGLIGGIPKEF